MIIIFPHQVAKAIRYEKIVRKIFTSVISKKKFMDSIQIIKILLFIENYYFQKPKKLIENIRSFLKRL